MLSLEQRNLINLGKELKICMIQQQNKQTNKTGLILLTKMPFPVAKDRQPLSDSKKRDTGRPLF